MNETLKCPYCGNAMMHATDRTYDYDWCPFCFAQSPAVKHGTDPETGLDYTFSIATGKKATIYEAAEIACGMGERDDFKPMNESEN